MDKTAASFVKHILEQFINARQQTAYRQHSEAPSTNVVVTTWLSYNLSNQLLVEDVAVESRI